MAARRTRVLPVLQEADFLTALAEPGASLEIECLTAPDPAKRHRGEWLFHVRRASGERMMLITAKGHERVVNTMEGVISLAATAAQVAIVSVPLTAGGIATGMHRRA